MNRVLLLSALILSSLTFEVKCQEFYVKSVKRVSYENKLKINVGDTIQPGTSFLFKKRGRLTIQHENGWEFLYTDLSNLDYDCLRSFIESDLNFLKHDSIYEKLLNLGLHNCDFKYKLTSASSGPVLAHSIADAIEVDAEPLTDVREEITVNFKHPISTYNGKFYLLLDNMFDEHIGLVKLNDISFKISREQFPYDNVILYKIFSEECRESLGHAIRFETK